MAPADEPVLDSGDDRRNNHSTTSPALAERISRLVAGQPYGVLCTHGADHAYGSLIAFAFADDLSTAVFATPRATRKYRLLTDHDRVALVVDNRSQHPGELMSVEAITATGCAREITDSEDHAKLAAGLVAKHPQLKPFVEAESCALFEVEILRILHVTRFQEVRQWLPQPK